MVTSAPLDYLSEPPRGGGSDASGPCRVRLDLAYDGADFRGFAENAGVRTVAGELRGVLEQVLGQPIVLTCAGRTDAGVHARAQVVTFDVERADPDLDRMRKAVNSMLGPRVAVREARLVEADFDARFSACWRSYRYQVLQAPVPDPFLAATSWWIDDVLDLDAMREAGLDLVGEHDFSSFCRRPRSSEPVSLVRRVLRCAWSTRPVESLDAARLHTFEIIATAFCHQMVRSIVGTLVAVGRAGRGHFDVAALLEARSRAGAPKLAPPHGLILWEVGYQPWTGTLADGR